MTAEHFQGAPATCFSYRLAGSNLYVGYKAPGLVLSLSERATGASRVLRRAEQMRCAFLRRPLGAALRGKN
jgi:hypothetical protein